MDRLDAVLCMDLHERILHTKENGYQKKNNLNHSDHQLFDVRHCHSSNKSKLCQQSPASFSAASRLASPKSKRGPQLQYEHFEPFNEKPKKNHHTTCSLTGEKGSYIPVFRNAVDEVEDVS